MRPALSLILVALLASLSLSAAPTLPVSPSADPATAKAKPPSTIHDYAEQGERETGIPAAWTLAVAIYESGGDLKHTPARCADGSVDLGPGFNSRWLSWYAKAFNHGEAFDPTSPYAVLIVARALAWLYGTFRTFDLAATGYHRGEGWTARNGVDEEYVGRVRAWL